eukprot:536040_1
MSAPQPQRQRYTRKELLTWKKAQLIREGNKYKLRLTGTKNEMINKLLEAMPAMDNQLANKRKSKSSKKPKLNKYDYMKIDEKNDRITSYYLRKCKIFHYPSVATNIIIEYAE